MQNCLQSSKVRTKRILRLCSICFVVVLGACCLKYALDNRRNTEFSGVHAKYLKTGARNNPVNVATGYETVGQNEVKMNNELLGVAKIYDSDVNFTQNAGFSDKVRVLMNDGSVKSMDVEEYVLGCVLGEMPSSFEPQALMAQSVAVRSFTARILLVGSSKHKNANVCTDPSCCQSYKSPKDSNLSEERMAKLSGAVNATRGVVALYDGVPIEAVYHASSGECTLNSEDVWGGRVEYLRSVPSPEGESELQGVLYGHRVGMSQHGANLLAKEGMGYAGILCYYYSGISLGFM